MYPLLDLRYFLKMSISWSSWPLRISKQ